MACPRLQCQVFLSSVLAHEKQENVLIKSVQLLDIMGLLATAGTADIHKSSQVRIVRFATSAIDGVFRVSLTASYTQSILSKFPESFLIVLRTPGDMCRDALC
jgi:hypothetical protein